MLPLSWCGWPSDSDRCCCQGTRVLSVYENDLNLKHCLDSDGDGDEDEDGHDGVDDDGCFSCLVLAVAPSYPYDDWYVPWLVMIVMMVVAMMMLIVAFFEYGHYHHEPSL